MCKKWVAGLLNRGPWGPSSLLGLVLTASNCNNRLQTNWTSCRTRLYHWLTPTCFLWASHLHPIHPTHSQGHTLTSLTGCTCSLIDDWVGGQYVAHVCVCVCVCLYIYIYIYVCVCVFIYIYIYIHTQTFVVVCVYIYIYIYIYI